MKYKSNSNRKKALYLYQGKDKRMTRRHVTVIITRLMMLFSTYVCLMMKHLNVQSSRNGLGKSVIYGLSLFPQSLVSFIKKLGKLAVLGLNVCLHLPPHPHDLFLSILLTGLYNLELADQRLLKLRSLAHHTSTIPNIIGVRISRSMWLGRKVGSQSIRPTLVWLFDRMSVCHKVDGQRLARRISTICQLYMLAKKI